MSAPHGGVSPLALIGSAPEHRSHRGKWELERGLLNKMFGLYKRPAVYAGVDIHPTALIEAFATVDSGISEPTTIGPRSWVFKHAHVGHDCVIGADVEIATGVVLGGHTVVGNGVRIGVNATTVPFVRIGDGARIGSGAVITKDVPDNEVWAGNPARKLRDTNHEERVLAMQGAHAGERWE